MLELILRDILTTTSICGLLAVILVIAQRYLNDYGDCQITINNQKDLIVKGGNSLLNSLAEKQLFLPSACGGKGSCGTCKCVVNEGGGPLLPTEKPYLNPQELTKNVRLACQVKVRTNLKIIIPETIFNIKRYKAKVCEIIDYTYDIKGVTFCLIDPETISFKAGQYVQLEIPPYNKVKQKTIRAYSISSKPEDNNKIQLIIRLVAEGIATTWIHRYMKLGDEIYFTGPYGDFYIRDSNSDILFIAGGSGKAPIKSMLEHLAVTGCSRRMVYFFGARTLRDLYLTEEMQSFEKTFPSFQYIPVLSQPKPEDQWSGKKGYVVPYLKEAIKDVNNIEVYMCGSPAMLDSCEKELLKLGIPRENIFYDSFG